MTSRSGRFCAVVFRSRMTELEPSASEHASTANEGVLIWPRRTFRAFRLQVGVEKPPSTDSHKTSFYRIRTGPASMISLASSWSGFQQLECAIAHTREMRLAGVLSRVILLSTPLPVTP